MNTLGLPVGWMALFGGRELPVYLQVVLPAFTLLGLHILFVAVRDSFRWRRFGRLEMTLDPLPGSIGGHVGGSLEIPLRQAPAAESRVLLMCIRDRLVKTKDGSSRSESVEWGKETLPKIERSGRDLRLRVVRVRRHRGGVTLSFPAGRDGRCRLRRILPSCFRRRACLDDALGALLSAQLFGGGNPERQGGHPQELLSPVQADGPTRGPSKNRDGRTQPCGTGRRVPLGDGIPLGRQSEILAALLEEAIGIPVETVKRSRPRLRS